MVTKEKYQPEHDMDYQLCNIGKSAGKVRGPVLGNILSVVALKVYLVKPKNRTSLVKNAPQDRQHLVDIDAVAV